MSSDVNTSALLRLSFITSLFIMNLLCLIKMLCHRLGHCVHTTTCAFIVIGSCAYLSSWLPYLFHSFYNSTVWPLLDIRDHCVIQHVVSGQITTILLAVLCMRKLYDAFSPRRARTLSYAACIAWIVPQLVYLTMGEIVNVDDNNSYHFLDRVHLPAANASAGTDLTSSSSSAIVSTEGFMICVHKMSGAVVAQISWHYVVLVIPLTAMLLICLATYYVRKSFSDNSTTEANQSDCNCSSDAILGLCLYLNFIWLLLLRPLVVLKSLMSQSSDGLPSVGHDWPTINPLIQQTPTINLDFGTHLILIIVALFVPFSTHGGFRTDIAKRLANARLQSMQNYYPTTAIKALEANYLDLDVSGDQVVVVGGVDNESVKRIKINNTLY